MLNESFRPSNTTKTLKNKIEEYFQYCDAIYPHELNKYHLTDEKAFRFLFYQAFRPLKSRGGKKGDRPRFDIADYKEVIARFDGEPCSPSANPMPVQALKPMAWSNFAHYKQVLKKIYKNEVMEKSTSLVWDNIWTQACDDLADQVKTRKAFIKKSTYQEKITSEFAPYTIVERYPEIEHELWNDCVKAVGPRQIVCQLRHRYCAQHTASGILRAESLYRAEFSDFLMISPPRSETDIHKVQIMINQVSQGKPTKADYFMEELCDTATLGFVQLVP
jgi:hypothetical protein